MAVEAYGDRCHVVYCDTMASEHPDNARFFADVERWIGRKIEVIRSEKYVTVDDVFERTRFMSSPFGARCTTELKKLPREAFQEPSDTHIFGYTSEETRRAASFEEHNPALVVEWLLIDRGVTKARCLGMLEQAGITLPEMYKLGFDHNNCPGCVKSQAPGYWNRVRRNFPEAFERRVRQSRLIGVRLVKIDGERVFLDELPPDLDGPDDDIDCGPVCQIPLFPLGRAP
jgi:hypothetical protein